MKHICSLLPLLSIVVLTATIAFAAQPAYLSITGEIQGQIRGGVTIGGKEGTIEVISLSHEIVSPRDAASGLPTGKRQHKPLTIRKAIDKSSPLLFRALISNENLKTVEFVFYTTDPRGQERPYYRIKLLNASIASIKTAVPDTKDPALSSYPLYEDISFTYQKIEWTYVDGGITTQDDWLSPVQ